MNRDRTLSSADRNNTIDFERYKRTLASTYHLQKQSYHVIKKWKYNFDQEIMNENPEMSDFLKNH